MVKSFYKILTTGEALMCNKVDKFKHLLNIKKRFAFFKSVRIIIVSIFEICCNKHVSIFKWKE